MIPIRISLAGFISYRERQELFFAGASLWVIAGPNGSGKSTIFDAVTYALYGKARDDVRVADLLNRRSDKMEVEYDFATGNQVFRIRRTRSRRGSQTVGAFRLGEGSLTGEEVVEAVEDTDSVEGLDRWVRGTIGLGFNAFTASVLLRQGKSDQLLLVPPRERFSILSELIDLSPYQRLHELVDSQRRTWTEKERGYATLLKDRPAVDVAELTSVRNSVQIADEEANAARTHAETLNSLLPLSLRWEEANAALAAIEAERQKDEEILRRSDEIDFGRKRRQVLGQVLPDLEVVVDTRPLIADLTNQLEALDRELAGLETQLREAELLSSEARSKATKLGEVIESWNDRLTGLAQEKNRLAPLLHDLIEISRAEARIAETEAELATFAIDITDRFNASRTEAAKLEVFSREFPALDEFSRIRKQLHARFSSLTAAQTELTASDEPSLIVDQRIHAATLAWEAATECERIAAAALSTAREYHRVCEERRDRFDQAAIDARCGVCGQAISSETATHEHKRLEDEVASAKKALNEAKDTWCDSGQSLATLSAKLNDLKSERDAVQNQRQELAGQVNLEERRVADGVAELERAYARLSQVQRVRVTEEAIINPRDWLSTMYPLDEDVERFRKDVARLPQVMKTRDELDKLVSARTRAEEHKRSDCARIQEIEQAHSRLALLNARNREEALVKEEFEAIEERDQLRLQRDNERAAEEKWQSFWHGKNEEFKRRNQARGETDNSLRVEIAKLQSALSRIPAEWQASADLVSFRDIEQLREEFGRCAEYLRLWEDLLRAQTRSEGRHQREAEYRQRLANLPSAAQRSPRDVEQDLGEANTRVTRADEARIATAAELSVLNERVRQRDETEDFHRVADRQRQLHQTLADLLGRNGLQLFLLRRAEMIMVEEANQILDRISAGRMRLRLRTEESNLSDRALDLIYDDFETDAEAIPIGMASGSQRFRIALSLALAIGRYLTRESQGVHSVIVDEGFGSLDRAGRSTMIQELTQLQSELERIILVSHQEEITDAFPNGYSISLVDGASFASLIHSS